MENKCRFGDDPNQPRYLTNKEIDKIYEMKPLSKDFVTFFNEAWRNKTMENKWIDYEEWIFLLEFRKSKEKSLKEFLVGTNWYDIILEKTILNTGKIMEENNKYYAPSIEEFFVGFEHEVRSFDSEDWEDIKYMIFPKTVYNIGYCNLFDYIKKSLDKDRIRVKYLDSDDIISLGWRHDPSGERYFELGEYQLYLNIHPIHNITIYDRSGIIFQGTIKNKSELKKVLNMLNIK